MSRFLSGTGLQAVHHVLLARSLETCLQLHDLVAEARGALECAGLLDGTGEPWRMRDRADLVMRFIALSMPAGFTYEPVVVPSLNGLLRADIGYGLFEGASC